MFDSAKLIVYGVVFAILLVGVGVVVKKANSWENGKAREYKEALAECNANNEKLRKMIADRDAQEAKLTTAYLNLMLNTNKEVEHAEAVRDAYWKPLLARAQAANRKPVVVPADSIRLLNDVSKLANEGNTSPAAGQDQATPDPVPDASGDILVSAKDLDTYHVAAGMAYADAVGKYRACVNFYEGLRAEEAKGLR